MLTIQTLRLLLVSAPEILDQTFDTYLKSIETRSNLALPFEGPAGTDQARKLELGIFETATRAFEIVLIRDGSGEEGVRAADSVRDVLLAVHLPGEQASGRGGPWEGGITIIEDFVKSRGCRLGSSQSEKDE